jgi:hypothetical protein
MRLAVTSSSVGANTVKAVMPLDGNLLGAGSGSAALISYDSTATAANFTAGTIPNGSLLMITYVPSGQIQFFPEKIPVQAGEAIYVAFSAAGSAILYIEAA